MNAYLDSSAVVKLVRAEPGHEVVAQLRDAATSLATCMITYAEVRSAAARGIRGRTQLSRARREIDAVWSELIRLAVGEDAAAEAGDLAERHGLRGMDALHLASAMRFAAASSPEEVVFVSWDRDQRAAARAEGMDLLPLEL